MIHIRVPGEPGNEARQRLLLFLLVLCLNSLTMTGTQSNWKGSDELQLAFWGRKELSFAP